MKFSFPRAVSWILVAAIVEGSSAVVLKTASGAAAGDFRLENGIEVSALCGSCCLGGRYCGNLSEAVVISDNTGRLANGDIIPAGTRLRCFLEDRSAPGAIDQGRCVPALDPSLSVAELAQFCARQNGTNLISPVTYEASLVPTSGACESCCNGTRACVDGHTCYAGPDTGSGFCVPDNTDKSKIATFCRNQSLQADKILQCESCVVLSPSAQSLYDSIFPPDLLHSNSTEPSSGLISGNPSSGPSAEPTRGPSFGPTKGPSPSPDFSRGPSSDLQTG